MRRPKKSPLERAAAIIVAMPVERRTALRERVVTLRAQLRDVERMQRRLAAEGSIKHAVRVALVANAQAAADGARDVVKLLALLDAIGGAS